MRAVNKETWRRQVQISMPQHVLDTLDQLAKSDANVVVAKHGEWHPGCKPNRSGTV